MDVQSYVSLSHQMALRRRLDVAANNIANMNTAGFKRENIVFHTQVEQMRRAASPDARRVAYVLDYGMALDTTQGEFKPTGNPLDVAVAGPGYLAVRTADGSTAYTRNGNFQRLASGQLGLVTGELVLDAEGQPIEIGADENDIHITEDGLLSTSAGEKGRLQVAVFADETKLVQRGDSLLDGTPERILPPEEVQLKPGMVEGSNVRPIIETTEMIDILRSYQTTQKLVERTSEMRRRAIERLGKVN